MARAAGRGAERRTEAGRRSRFPESSATATGAATHSPPGSRSALRRATPSRGPRSSELAAARGASPALGLREHDLAEHLAAEHRGEPLPRFGERERLIDYRSHVTVDAQL